jgi:hypothetical protein
VRAPLIVTGVVLVFALVAAAATAVLPWAPRTLAVPRRGSA